MMTRKEKFKQRGTQEVGNSTFQIYTIEEKTPENSSVNVNFDKKLI